MKTSHQDGPGDGVVGKARESILAASNRSAVRLQDPLRAQSRRLEEAAKRPARSKDSATVSSRSSPSLRASPAEAQEQEPFNDLPAEARSAFAAPGVPLDPSLAHSMGTRLGADFGSVRVHVDAGAAAATRALGAQAFAFGPHIAFNRNAWSPHTARGQSLLTHELAHVAQQMQGDRSDESVQERTAEEAALGGAPSWPRGSSARAVLRLRRGDVQRVTIRLGDGDTATFELQIEDSEAVSGSGTASGLDAGEYLIQAGGRDLEHMPITMADGTPLPRSSGFHLTIPRAVARALRAAPVGTIPLTVRSADTGPVPSASSGGTGPGIGTAAGTPRQQLEALPQRLRDFLFSNTGPAVRPEEIPTLLRIADAVSDLSDDELLEYRARTVGATTDVNIFERGVTAWLAEVRQRRIAIAEEQSAANELYGKEALYDLYLAWLRTTNTGGGLVPTGIAPPRGQLSDYEATPFASLHVSTEGMGWQQYYDFRRALDAAGYANIAVFEAALHRFLDGFRERAYYVALESMGRYEHLLIEQRSYYQNAEVLDALHGRLATAQRQVAAADSAGRTATLLSMGEDTGDLAHEMREERARQEAAATSSVAAATTGTDPIASERGFDPLELARQDRTHIGGFLVDYIDERLGNIRRTRENLSRNHELIFGFDALVRSTKQRSDIDDNTIWARVIADHSAPPIEAALFGIITGVLLVALTIATAGTGLPALLVAGGSLLASGYFAVEAYEDYSLRSDAYGAQLLSTEPWFGWVVIAIVGAGLDLAAVGVTLRALRPAVAALEATGNLPAFNAAVNDLVENPQTRRAILEAAAARTEARSAWRAVSEAPTLAPRGAARASVFGLDIVIDAALALPRTVYAVWLEARAGVRSFQRWILTPEAVELFGDVAQFSPSHLREVQSIYQQASAALERVAVHARSVGMSADEVDGVLRWWARWQRGTADDLIRLLDRQGAVTIEASVLARMGAEVDVSRVRMVAAAIDDRALQAELLRDARVWRMLHNADYNPDTLRRAWTDFQRARSPSHELTSTSFGDYLFNSSAYRTTVGGTAPRPLAAVIPNWVGLVGAQRTQAVFHAAEPRLAAALAGTDPVPGLNPETVAQLRQLLQSDVVGPGVTMYDGARSTVMGLANEIIGRTTRTEAELRAILALTESSGSAGSIGERFVSTVLAHPNFAAGDLTHVSFSAAELPGLRGGRSAFEADRAVVAAHQTLEVKTGYAGGIDITDQAHNYELLRAISQADPGGAVATRLGGPLSGHNWLALPGAEAAATPAQAVARRIWSQLEREGLSLFQRVFYLDSTGSIMRVTGPTTQVRVGATIHEALGLVPSP